MARLDGSHTPSGYQAIVLGHLVDGWELIISQWCDAAYNIMLENARANRRRTPSRERIFWRWYEPKYKFNPWDELDCGSPRMHRYQMSHLERYGWVTQHETGWTITEKGREAYERYKAKYT